MGGEKRSDSVGIFVAEKCMDSVVSVERHRKRVLILKMVLDNGLLNVLQFMLFNQENQRGNRKFFEWSVPFGELYTSEENGCLSW